MPPVTRLSAIDDEFGWKNVVVWPAPMLNVFQLMMAFWLRLVDDDAAGALAGDAGGAADHARALRPGGGRRGSQRQERGGGQQQMSQVRVHGGPATAWPSG